tara:strand:+ start:154 stop:348 length:195 start_codon:yes stop_codon:yes gene_type:complete
MLKTQAEAEKSKALLTLELLNIKGVGVEEHTTKDFYENTKEAYMMLVDANEKLQTLITLYKLKI